MSLITIIELVILSLVLGTIISISILILVRAVVFDAEDTAALRHRREGTA